MSNIAAPEKAKELVQKHEGVLKEAIDAIHTRKFYAHYPEPPSKRIYGENAMSEGVGAYKAQLGNKYEGLLQDSDGWLEAAEESPYTLERLGISYPVSSDPEAYITRSQTAYKEWKKVDPETRAAILKESLDNIRERFFEMAFSTMHTTGQSFMMSFQASGPHSNDRALEAIALGLHEQTRFPSETDWEKPMGRDKEGNMRFVKLQKYFRAVPLGIGLCIGCSTFPVWNSTPGLYANLITGNTSILKPHPLVIYPAAIVVEELQKTFKEYGLDPHIVQLAVGSLEKPITKHLAEHKAVQIIDYTGSSAFGDYVESLPGKRAFTEKAGVNSVVMHSIKNMKATMQNLSFSLSLYSGQMCTAPQNIFIPKGGITSGGEYLSYDDAVAALTGAVKGLVTHEKMGPGTLGAIQSMATYDRVKEAEGMGFKVLLASQSVNNPEFPKARIATPAIIEVPSDRLDIIEKEMFGPIVYVVPVDDAKHGVAIAKDLAQRHGAITFTGLTSDDDMMDYMTDEMTEAFTPVAFNFVGPIWVNQSAGFSDFHVTGGNPSGNASLTDPEFVLRRFEYVGVRVMR